LKEAEDKKEPQIEPLTEWVSWWQGPLKDFPGAEGIKVQNFPIDLFTSLIVLARQHQDCRR
jgi:hypothetical protein